MAKVIGIDLGTTNSVVSVVEGGEATVIPNQEGSRLTPSVAAFTKEGETLVGQVAKRQAITNPENTVFSIKRFMGRRFDEVTEEMRMVPYRVVRAENGDARVDIKGKNSSPPEISAMILQKLKQAAEDYLGTKVERGVEVKATNGDTHLGGDNIDQRIIDWIIDEFTKSNGIDLSSDRVALQRLKEAAEKAKIELSSTVETEINLPFITADSTGPKHLSLKLTRAKLEQLANDIFQKTIAPCKQALEGAGLRPSEIDEVVLVGGSTRIPKVQEMVRDFFGKDPHKGVNPDEVVALGAAVQAGVLGGEVKALLLLDVTPLSLGIETLGGVFTRLIERNTTIPHKKSEVFSTAADNQTQVEVHVLQGERAMAGDNRTLGRFHLVGIPPAPRGVPQVEVTFDIDANGILNVSAKDLATSKEQRITITASSGLTKDEVEKMIKEADVHSEEDKKRKELIELRNQLDSIIYATEKTLNEHKAKLPVSDVKNIEDAIAEGKKALEKEDAAEIKKALDNISKVSHKMAEVMYQAASQASQTAEGGATPEAKKEADVVDAEFVDEENKRENR